MNVLAFAPSLIIRLIFWSCTRKFSLQTQLAQEGATAA